MTSQDANDPWVLTRTLAENVTHFCEHRSRSLDLRKQCNELRTTIAKLEGVLTAATSDEQKENEMAACVLENILRQGGALQTQLQGSGLATALSTQTRVQAEQIAFELRQKLLTGAAKTRAASTSDSDYSSEPDMEGRELEPSKKRTRNSIDIREPDEFTCSSTGGHLRTDAMDSWRPTDNDRDANAMCPYFNSREGCRRHSRDCWLAHQCSVCRSWLHSSYTCTA